MLICLQKPPWISCYPENITNNKYLRLFLNNHNPLKDSKRRHTFVFAIPEHLDCTFFIII